MLKQNKIKLQQHGKISKQLLNSMSTYLQTYNKNQFLPLNNQKEMNKLQYSIKQHTQLNSKYITNQKIKSQLIDQLLLNNELTGTMNILYNHFSPDEGNPPVIVFVNTYF